MTNLAVWNSEVYFANFGRLVLFGGLLDIRRLGLVSIVLGALDIKLNAFAHSELVFDKSWLGCNFCLEFYMINGFLSESSKSVALPVNSTVANCKGYFGDMAFSLYGPSTLDSP